MTVSYCGNVLATTLAIILLLHCPSIPALLIGPKHTINSATCWKRLTPLLDSRVVPEVQNATDLSLGLQQLKPFLKIAVPFFKEDETARNSLLGVAGLTLLNSGISVAFSYISRDFYNALNARDEPLFYEKIELFFGALLLAVPVSVYYRFLREKLAIYWREALTENVLEKYYSNRTYYIVETMRDVDNPDQRISEDIRRFTSTSLDFFITLFTSVIDLFSFSAILFQIYPGLFVAIVGYAGVGSIVTTNLGKSLVGLNYERLQREANFRFSLLRTRENAEAIAFYDDKATSEREGVWQLFKQALETQLGIALAQRNLEYFTTSYRYIVQILPSLIVAPLYFANKVELGAISQSYGAFNHILGDFSIIINQFEALSAFSAGLTRLATFIDRIDDKGWGSTTLDDAATTGQVLQFSEIEEERKENAREVDAKPLIRMRTATAAGIPVGTKGDEAPPPPPQRGAVLDTSIEWILQARNLTVLTPDARRIVVGAVSDDSQEGGAGGVRSGLVEYASSTLSDDNDDDDGDDVDNSSTSCCRGVDVTVAPGDQVLIVGASGAGKSSFVRAIAGLWQVGYGSVFWNQDLTGATAAKGKVTPAAVAGAPTGEEVQPDPQQSVDSASAPERVFFLPQKSYNVLGSLREQIMYPNRRTPSSQHAEEGEEEEMSRQEHADDDYFLELLRSVRLGGLAERMGNGDPSAGLSAVKDWGKVLSLGEQQRLAFARVLYNQPAVVVLDEATSALDLNTEEAMYSVLREKLGPHTTYMSVGHRPTLLRYHKQKLVLRGPGVRPVMVDIPQSSEAMQEKLQDLAAI